jgi:hypothetical protein
VVELALGLLLLSIIVLIWGTCVVYFWKRERTRRIIAEAECEIYKDLLINRIINGKDETNEADKAG